MTPPFQLLVEVIEQKIGEQRRQRTTLRSALVPVDAHTSLQHPRFEETTDDLQEAFIANAPRQTRHQDVVVDPVEGRHDRLPTTWMIRLR